jgi:hypothetical protein
MPWRSRLGGATAPAESALDKPERLAERQPLLDRGAAGDVEFLERLDDLQAERLQASAIRCR